MNSTDQPSQPPVVRWGIRLAGTIAILIGAFWLVAWFTGYGAHWSAGGVLTVKTNTALALFLGGLALVLLSAGRPNTARRTVGTVAAVVILLIGALTLSQHLFGWNLGIDQLLATEAPGAVSTSSPNRPGPPASVSFTLLGIGLLGLASGRRRIAPYLGLAISMINLIPAVGFLYGVGTFFAQPRLTHIAWPTVIALISLGIGLVFSRTDGGPMALLLRDDAGGKLLRRMLPWLIVVPLVLGHAKMQFEYAGLGITGSRTGLLVVALILIFSAVLWRSARDLSRSDTAHRQDEEALRESEERLRLAHSAARLGAFEWNIRTDTNTWTPELEAMYGLRPGGFAGTASAWQEFIHPDDRANATRLVEHSIQTGETTEGEWRVVWPDGSIHWLAARWQVFRDESGEPLRMIGVNMDITDRKQAEEELEKERKQLLAIIESLDEAVGVWNTDGSLALINDATAKLYGYEMKEQMLRHLSDYADVQVRTMDGCELPPEEWPPSRVLRGETFSDWELEQYIPSINKRFIGSNSGRPVRDANGKIILGVTSVRDITERKQAEEALAAAQRQIQSIIDNATSLVYALDLEERFLMVNRALAELLDSTPEQMIGRRRHEFMPKADADRHEANDRQAIEAGKALEFEEYSELPGRSITWLTTKFPLRDAQGTIYAVGGITADISDRKKTEDALRESRTKLQAAFASMTEAIFIADTEGRLVEFNEGFVRYHRFKDREECSRTIADCPKYLEAYFQDGTPAPPEMWAMPRALRGEMASDVEYMLRRKESGETWWGSYNFAPIKDEDGKIVGAIVACREITERKKAEEALRQSEQTFSELIERAPFGVYLIDSQFRIAQMNTNSQDDAFRNVRPVIGRDFTEAMHILWPDDVAEGILALFRHTLETGEPYYSPRFTNPRHDVEIVESYEWELHRMKLPSGEYGVVCYYYDSTKLRQAEAAVREEQDHKLEFYQRTILAATDGKLSIADRTEIERIAGPSVASWEIRSPKDIGTVRHGVQEIAVSAGIEEPRLGKLIVAVGEATTNAVKHASGGEASLHQTGDSLIVVVSDRGPGIPALALPDVALRNRYSTAGTLGMGYKMMIQFVDKIYLATDESGTTVGIEISLEPVTAEPLLIEKAAS